MISVIYVLFIMNLYGLIVFLLCFSFSTSSHIDVNNLELKKQTKKTSQDQRILHDVEDETDEDSASPLPLSQSSCDSVVIDDLLKANRNTSMLDEVSESFCREGSVEIDELVKVNSGDDISNTLKYNLRPRPG